MPPKTLMTFLVAIVISAAALACFGCADPVDPRQNQPFEREPPPPPSLPPLPPPERKEWTPPTRGESSETINASELWQIYGANRLQADVRFKDKWLEVNGVADLMRDDEDRDYVGLFKPSFAGKPAATLTLREKKWARVGAPANVLGFIRPGSEKQFSDLKPGSPVRVIGLCQGRREDESVSKNYTVDLLFCELVEKKPATP